MKTKNTLVNLNKTRCAEVATIIKPLKLKQEFYNREYLTLDVDEETKFRMNFFAVAICHQTHKLYHPKFDIYGWDFLEYGFVNLAKNKAQVLDPKFLDTADISTISRELAKAFTHTKNILDCSLDNLDERAQLMKDAANVLLRDFNGKVSQLFQDADNHLQNNDHGLYKLFLRFEAFVDPQQKKTTFLIKLLEESNLITIKDPENFIPIMDYHMQRVLLRLGCVEILDQNLRTNILEQMVLDSDEPIRTYCIEAFKLIAKHSGHPITKMNDFFWSMGRSCCHITTLCHDRVCEKSPCTFDEIVELDDHSTCIFQSVCPGAKDENYRKLWQPIVKTHFY